jgi:flavoprotein
MDVENGRVEEQREYLKERVCERERECVSVCKRERERESDLPIVRVRDQ